MGSRVLTIFFWILFLCGLFGVFWLAWWAFWHLVFALTDLAGGGLVSFLWAVYISVLIAAGLFGFYRSYRRKHMGGKRGRALEEGRR